MVTIRKLNIAEAVARILEAEVPGLACETRVAFNREGGPLELVAVYQCPCGEESMLSQLWDARELDRYSMPVERLAELEAAKLKVALREHVISEGNTPGF